VTERAHSGRHGDALASDAAICRQEEHPDSRDAEQRDDLYGEDSFPASDPPSTWWGESRKSDYPAVAIEPSAADQPIMLDAPGDVGSER